MLGSALAMRIWPRNALCGKRSSNVSLQEYGMAAMYGMLTGLMELPILFGFASIIFADDALQPHLPVLNKMYQFSGVVFGLSFMFFDKLPWTVANAQDTPTIFLATATSIILSRMHSGDDDEEADDRTLATVLITIMLGSLACGVVFGLFASFPKLTALVHYIPSPVLSGFLASVGLFLISGGFAMAVPDFKDWPDIGELGNMGDAHNFIPALLYGVFVWLVSTFANNPLASAAAMLFGIPVFYIVVAIMGYSEADMRDRNMLLEVEYGVSPVGAWEAMDPSKVDWGAVGAATPELLKLAVIFPLLMLLNSVALEAKFDTDIDWGRELKMYTGSHLLVGLGGGLPGGRLMSHTILINQSLPELRTKATMLFNTAVFVVAWLFDPPIARYIPRCFAAGLLIFIGVSMFFEFAWTIRTRVTPQDYILVLLTIVLINTLGINIGLVLSILASVILFTVLYSTVPIVERVFTRPSTLNRVSAERKQLSKLRGSIMMFKIHGYMFFGSASQLLAVVQREVAHDLKEGRKPQFVFMDGRRLQGIDSSAVVELSRLQRWIHSHHLKLVFSDLREDLFRFLQRQGIIPLDPNDADRAQRRQINHVLSFEDIDQGLEWCEHNLLHPDEMDPNMPLFSDFTTPKLHRRSESTRPDLIGQKVEALKHAFNTLNETITDEQAEGCCPYVDLVTERAGFVFADPFVHAKEMYLLIGGVVHIYVTEKQYSAELFRSYSHQSENQANDNATTDEQAIINIASGDRKRRIGTLVDGGIIGSVGMVLGEMNSYLAVAATECVLIRISRYQLNAMKENRPDLTIVTQGLLLKSMALHIKDNYLTWLQEDMSLDRPADERGVLSSLRRRFRAIRGVFPKPSNSNVV